jgi:hypothetical protein
MITQRDFEIFKFINKYGKSYLPVMEKTFFPSQYSAKNRINELIKNGLISTWNTKLASPKKALVLSQEIKEYMWDELDIRIKQTKINMSTIHHNIIEQIADFHLSKIGTIERTTVAKHSDKLHHVPDFIFTTQNNQKFNIEIELTKKSLPRYKAILMATIKDNVAGILYIVNKKSDIKKYAEFLPRDKRLLIIDIDTLIENIKNLGRINPFSQEQFLLQAQ